MTRSFAAGWLVLSVASLGCGRRGFDQTSACEGSCGTDGGEPDTLDAPDAPPDGNPACLIADGVCVHGCAGIDDDCSTVCGDGTCVGNADELCSTCAADCRTRDPVCGNGACETGESPGCYADCGPSPWTWDDEETELRQRINSVRATGFNCPNGARGPAGSVAAGPFTDAARELAWETGHQMYADVGGTTCNGRTEGERSQNFALYRGYMRTGSQMTTTVEGVLQRWLALPANCDVLLDNVVTEVSIAVVHDMANGYVLIFN